MDVRDIVVKMAGSLTEPDPLPLFPKWSAGKYAIGLLETELLYHITMLKLQQSE